MVNLLKSWTWALILYFHRLHHTCQSFVGVSIFIKSHSNMVVGNSDFWMGVPEYWFSYDKTLPFLFNEFFVGTSIIQDSAQIEAAASSSLSTLIPTDTLRRRQSSFAAQKATTMISILQRPFNKFLIGNISSLRQETRRRWPCECDWAECRWWQNCPSPRSTLNSLIIWVCLSFSSTLASYRLIDMSMKWLHA